MQGNEEIGGRNYEEESRRKQKSAKASRGRPSIARFKNQGLAYRSFFGRVFSPGIATSSSPVSRKEYISK